MTSLQVNRNAKFAENNRKNNLPGSSVPKEQKFIVKKFGTVNPIR
jgi:hypothetical protein